MFRAQQGWNVIVSSPKEYLLNILPSVEALVVRSAVQVYVGDLLKEGSEVAQCGGRAGVGVDNVDLE